MLFKGFGLEFSLGKRAVKESNAVNAEKPGEDVVRLSDALLTPKRDIEDRKVARAPEPPLPLKVDAEEENIVKAAEALLTPMGGVGRTAAVESTVEKDLPALKDIFGQPAQKENLSANKESKAVTSEKGKEPVKVEAESKGKDGLINDLFAQDEEQEASPIQGLIASLPDVTLQEVFGAAQEVKALMQEWQSKEPGKVPRSTVPGK